MDQIIDQSTWLFKQIEQLMANDKDESAEPYLEKLLKNSNSAFQKAYCLRYLGRIAAARGDLPAAEKYLRAALSIETSDPDVLFLIGEAASETGTWWFALIHYLQAVRNAKESTDVLEIMRRIANAFERLNLGEVALSVLLGALDRDPEDPFVLSALENFYSKKEEWMEARRIGDTLVELIENKPSLDFELEDIRERLKHISLNLQSKIRIVNENSSNDVSLNRGEGTMVSTTLGPGLRTLVAVLSIHSRNAPLLGSAKALWAKSKDIQYDAYFSTPTLAAAIHWIVEKLHWRMPTSVQRLEMMYGADREQIFAAVRILVAQFQVGFFPDRKALEALGPRELESLRKAQKSLFFGSSEDFIKELE